jgi:lactoylglutathione lyase
MRTLHPGIRVTDLAASVAFYTALGYTVVGVVPNTAMGKLTLLKLPGDEFATIELVDDPRAKPIVLGNGMSHLAIQVESIADVAGRLATAGFTTGEIEHPGGPDGPQTSSVNDPDGRLIELTQWPAGHAAGLGEADFAR